MSAVAAAVVGGAALVGGATVAGLSVAATAALAAGGTALAANSAEKKAQKAANTAAGKQAEAAETLAQQADRSAELSYDLGQQQLAFSQRQYDEMSPLARRVAESQIAAQDEQMRQARDYYDYQTGTFRPLEQGLVRRAQEFDTAGYREQLAAQAAADAARAFDNTQAQTARGLSRMGVAPGSGASMAQMNQNALASASMRAGAMTGTRQQAEQLGYARMLDAAGLGRNLAGASTAAYQSATGAGSAGVTSAMAPGSQYTRDMGSAANTILTGSGQALGAYGQLYGGANTAAIGAQNNYMGALGGLVGIGGNVAAAKFGAKIP
jgi:hypothetical protein